MTPSIPRVLYAILKLTLGNARKLDRVLKNQEKIMSEQDDINAATAEDQSLLQDLTTRTANIQAAQANFDAEIQKLLAQGFDTSGLVAANAALVAAVSPFDASVDALTADSQAAGTAAAPSGT